MVIGEFEDSLDVTEDMIAAFARTTEIMHTWRESRTVESFEFFDGELGGCAIFVADDLGALEAVLEELPIVGDDAFSLTVKPLVDQSAESAASFREQLGLDA